MFDLRRYESHELTEAIVRGSRWKRYSEVHTRMSSAVFAPMLASIVRAELAKVEEEGRDFVETLKTDREAALRMLAAQYRRIGVDARAAMSLSPGWEKTGAGVVVSTIDSVVATLEAIAAGTEPPPPPFDRDTAEAKLLCEQAIAPWANLSRAEQEALYVRALDLDSTCPFVRMRYARFLAERPEGLAEATRHLRAALAVEPDDAELLDEIARVLLWQDRFDEMRAFSERLVRAQGETPHGLALLGAALVGVGELARAEELLERALALDPKCSIAHAAMSELKTAQGDTRGAQEHSRARALYGGSRSPATLRQRAG